MAELQEAEIRARIKHARKQAGLSQPKMAELLEVIPRTVQNYENDHVPWSRIKDIASITGVSTRWLLHGDGAPGDGDDQLDRIENMLTDLIERVARLQATLLVDEAEEPPQTGEAA